MYRFPHGFESQEGLPIEPTLTQVPPGTVTTTTRVTVNLPSPMAKPAPKQDLDAKKWHVPFVIEPSAGVDRGVLAVMNEAYTVEPRKS